MAERGVVIFGCLGAILVGGVMVFAASGAPAHAADPAADGASRGRRATAGRAAASARSPAAALASQNGACPKEMAQVGGACVDRFEARLLVRQTDGSLTPHPPYLPPEKGAFVAESQAGVKPQAYISQVQAAAACENAGKRLCSLVEWYRACSGSPRATYPYGPRYEARRCNVAKPHLLSMLHGSNPRNWSYADFNDPKLGQQTGFLALTGDYARCTSQEGVQDLVGNLHEWVADRVDHSLPKKVPIRAVIERRIGKTAGNGIFMGGFYSTLDEHGPGCTFVTAAHEPRYHDYSTGFRCCRDPRPPDEAQGR